MKFSSLINLIPDSMPLRDLQLKERLQISIIEFCRKVLGVMHLTSFTEHSLAKKMNLRFKRQRGNRKKCTTYFDNIFCCQY